MNDILLCLLSGELALIIWPLVVFVLFVLAMCGAFVKQCREDGLCIRRTQSALNVYRLERRFSKEKDLRLRFSVRTGFWSVQKENFGGFVGSLFRKDLGGGFFLDLLVCFSSWG